MASHILLNAGTGVLAAGVLFHAGPAALAASPAGHLVAVHKRLRDRTHVALTFDDGPQPDSLEQFLQVLETERAPATFFVVGERAASNPDLVKHLRDAGHTVANHGFAHRNHLFHGPRSIAADIEHGAATIAGITRERPTLYRPPYGIVAGATRVAAWRAHQRVVLWSRWGRDWRVRATSHSIATDATNGLRGGDIVLLHDADYYGSPVSWRNTLAALPRIIEHIRALGLEPVRIEGPDALA